MLLTAWRLNATADFSGTGRWAGRTVMALTRIWSNRWLGRSDGRWLFLTGSTRRGAVGGLFRFGESELGVGLADPYEPSGARPEWQGYLDWWRWGRGVSLYRVPKLKIGPYDP